MVLQYTITGMTCSACSSHVERSVSKLEGIKKVEVNLLTNSMTVDFDDRKVISQDIIKAVINSGYGIEQKVKNKEKQQSGKIEKEVGNMKTRVIISFLFLVPLMYVAMGHMLGLPLPNRLQKNAFLFALIQLILTLPILWVNRIYYIRGTKSLFKKAPNMDSLIAIGSFSAFLYGVYSLYKIGYGMRIENIEMVHHFSMNLYFESAGMILTLITLGKFLETRSKKKTTEAINKLMDLSPKTAIILKDGKEIEVKTEEIKVGDIVVIKPGSTIPVDGIIKKGTTYIDEASVTGESIPVKKEIGDLVISTTINKNGMIEVEAQKVGEDTTLSQIIKLVENASSSKAPIGKLADRISGVFVPVVIGIAMLSFLIWLLLGYSFEFALSIGISVLVISCPCALGLATPVSIMVASGKGASYGILIKSAQSLEIAHNIDVVVLDKTGTITIGKPKVTDVITKMEEKEFLKLIASLEKRSEHPIATSILEKAKEQEIEYKNIEVTDFQAFSGKGIKGKIENVVYFAGNEKLMIQQNINIQEYTSKFIKLSKEAKTVIYIGNDKEVLGTVAVSDVIKDTSKKAIHTLQKMGIEVYMLSGDNLQSANAIGEKLGIKQVIAEVLPGDKESMIHDLQKKEKVVCMVGDGINDAPALTRADVGVAIGAGTDIAIESADVVLMKSDLLDVVTLIQLGKKTIKNIKMNLFWAFFYNTIGIPIAAGVLYPTLGITLNPMIAAFAMSLSSICVVTNSLRLKNFKPTKIEEKEKGRNVMEKIVYIEGMSCGHCKNRVEDAFTKIEGVEVVEVNLEEKLAKLTLNKEIQNETLKNVVEEAGYKVTKIQ